MLEQGGIAPETCSTSCDDLKIHAPGDLPAGSEFKDLSWWLDQGHEAGIDPLTGERVALITNDSRHPPVWIIEAIHEVLPAESGATDLQVWYRILARGHGRTDAGISVIESIVVRSWAGTSELCPGSEPTANCGRVAWRELR